ncbi:Ku protein [Paenibacillus sp. N4]|uniref:non-homologous end joining protein Ku n=1 Tax=Paenibacillus vietnamensis TaxID=2590547 RepID=UPI001CD07C5B|nr:Ku protein [Paenibacillus vietnamensis]MCA0754890.1 Ku protein [Paenibacillus vietnamensis]
MQTIWKGAISFGLVHIPVKMHAATSDNDIHFRTLHKVCSTPIAQSRYCPHCDVKVETADTTKGYEYDKNRFVVFNEEEIEALKPDSARTIEIMTFADLAEIDPVYFAYYLSPDMAGSNAYSLLLESIRRSGKIGVARVTIRSKSRLAAIRVIDNCLCMETMHSPDEIRAVTNVPNIPEHVIVDKKELEIAQMLIDHLSKPFDPTQYKDDYRAALTQAIEQKLSGQSVDVVDVPAARSNVLDLMAALQASLEATGDQKPKKSKKKAKGNVS